MFKKFVVYSDLDYKDRIAMVLCDEDRICKDKHGNDVWIFSLEDVDIAIFDISKVVIRQEEFHYA